MRERRPSQTASSVALIRALADQGLTDVPGFEDPVVHRPAANLRLLVAERPGAG